MGEVPTEYIIMRRRNRDGIYWQVCIAYGEKGTVRGVTAVMNFRHRRKAVEYIKSLTRK